MPEAGLQRVAQQRLLALLVRRCLLHPRSKGTAGQRHAYILSAQARLHEDAKVSPLLGVLYALLARSFCAGLIAKLMVQRLFNAVLLKNWSQIL